MHTILKVRFLSKNWILTTLHWQKIEFLRQKWKAFLNISFSKASNNWILVPKIQILTQNWPKKPCENSILTNFWAKIRNLLSKLYIENEKMNFLRQNLDFDSKLNSRKESILTNLRAKIRYLQSKRLEKVGLLYQKWRFGTVCRSCKSKKQNSFSHELSLVNKIDKRGYQAKI